MRVLRLPVPPSVNALYGQRWGKKGKGRYKTKRYVEWLRQADKMLLTQQPWRGGTMTGPLELEIRLPKTRLDATNAIKAVEDYLVSRLITADDKHNRKVTVEIDPRLDCCEVTIRPYRAA